MAAIPATSCSGCTRPVARQPVLLGHRTALPCRAARSSPRLRAAAEDEQAATVGEAEASGSGRLFFGKDTESMEDVFAFAGPAPERVNGRIAMWAFVAAVAAEVASGRSVLEQLATAPLAVAATAALITAGSLAPKFASGVSLDSLIASSSREGLPKELAFFNKTHEIWLGRVAMLGFTGLVATELVLRRALF